METPTITKKQAKRTLSGRKKKPEVIKHVLAKPFEKFWPCLSDEHNDELKHVLEQCLPVVVLPKINIPYDKIKKIPKNDRKNFRSSLQKKVILEPDRLKLRFGINDVTVSLEKQEAASVLVANEVQPRLLVQHILDQAVLYDVPVLVVKNLKAICRERCGFAAAAVALMKPVEFGSKLVQIQQTIYSLSEHYPVPESHIHFNRKLDVSAITIQDSENGSVCVLSDSDSDKSELSEVRNYHLKRVGTKRTFIPPDSKPKVEAFINLDSTVDDSITVDDSTVDESFEITSENCGEEDGALQVQTAAFRASSKNKSPKRMAKKIANYRSLVVKKVKGDKNRNQRKMEKFKKKK